MGKRAREAPEHTCSNTLCSMVFTQDYPFLEVFSGLCADCRRIKILADEAKLMYPHEEVDPGAIKIDELNPEKYIEDDVFFFRKLLRDNSALAPVQAAQLRDLKERIELARPPGWHEAKRKLLEQSNG